MVGEHSKAEIYAKKRNARPRKKDCELKFACDIRNEKGEICGKAFEFPSGLQTHVKGSHKKLRPYACDKVKPNGVPCKSRFQYKSGLANHLLIHSAVKKFKCPWCEKCYHQRGQMLTHMKRVHGDSHDSFEEMQLTGEQLKKLSEQEA